MFPKNNDHPEHQNTTRDGMNVPSTLQVRTAAIYCEYKVLQNAEMD
jgi:hypothetical protein